MTPGRKDLMEDSKMMDDEDLGLEPNVKRKGQTPLISGKKPTRRKRYSMQFPHYSPGLHALWKRTSSDTKDAIFLYILRKLKHI